MSASGKFLIATFRVDVTPPIGHPLCAGWYSTALGIVDPLYAMGVILSGEDQPIVLCAIDWAEMSNLSHITWRRELALAAGTTPERVAVQCTHAHCTPWPDEEAQRLVAPYADVPQVMELGWCTGALSNVADAVKAAASKPMRLTHLGLGQAKVEQVASNRRILGADGKIKAIRWTKVSDPQVRAEPEGLIDPYLKTVSFWDDDRKIAALHYYAVHPTSYDTDRMVSSEFTGLARAQLNAEEPNVLHVYFTGCAGNITAGKYNDGAVANRPVLSDRIYRGMLESEKHIDRVAVSALEWRVEPVFLPPREDMNEPDLLACLADASRDPKVRNKAAIMLAGLRRQDQPIPFTYLNFGDRAGILNLPSESFIEYQLFAQQQRPASFVAVAAYGDCGPGYICMERSFDEGGYEPTDAFVSGKSEPLMKAAIAKLLN
jgi:hypothetical protein